MVIQEADGIKYRLRKLLDLSFIKRYGTVFQAIDQTGSGCICFGAKDNDKKYFIKIAGADTTEAECTPESSVCSLKKAVKIYSDLSHPYLIKLIEHYEYSGLYTAVFEWAEGEGLYDHWNFEKYEAEGKPAPNIRFRQLPADKKIAAALKILSFFENAAQKGYIGCDFYDGSLIYDFDTDKLTICDIDLFRKAPVINDMGEDYWGTKRLKAPEEYKRGAVIDQATNVFTLAALFFDMFGDYSDEDIAKRYENSEFLPCSPEKFSLPPDAYDVLVRAASPERTERYQTISEFSAACRSHLQSHRILT